MIFLYLILILQSVFSNEWILTHRIYLGGMPFNVTEGAMGLALLYLVLVPMKSSPLDYTKRNYLFPVVALWVVALTGGVVLGFSSGADLYLIMRPLKWFIKMPLGMACGYYAIRNLKNARWAIKFICLLSCIICVLLLVNFSGGSQTYLATGRYRAMQTLNYDARTCAIVACFIVFITAVNRRFISRPAGVMFLTMSILGVGVTMSRSLIITLIASVAAVLVIIPKEYRIHAWKALWTSGKWIVAAAVLGAISAQSFLGVNVIGIILDAFGDLGTETGSGVSRWVGAMNELKVWLGSTIIFGGGLGALETTWYEQDMQGSLGHNAWTGMLARMGLVGLIAFAYPLLVAFRIGRRMVREMDATVRAAGAMAMAAALLVGIITLLSGYNERTCLFLGVALGIAAKCYRFQLEPEPGDEEYDQFEQQYLEPGATY